MRAYPASRISKEARDTSAICMKSWIPTYEPTLSNSICPHSSQPSSSSALIAFRFDEKERYYTYKSQTLIPWALTDGTSCSLAGPLGHYVRLLFHVRFDREHFKLNIATENCLGIASLCLGVTCLGLDRWYFLLTCLPTWSLRETFVPCLL